MKYENFRQALRYLLHIVKFNPEARSHPAVLRLPEAVREELFDGTDNLLAELMASRSVKTDYTSSTYTEDDVIPDIRVKGFVPALPLLPDELAQVRLLIQAESYPEDVQRRVQSELDSLTRDGAEGVASVCLPHRSEHTSTIYCTQPSSDHKEGKTRVNYAHYSVDSALPHCSAPFEGKVARIHHLFLVADVPLALVTWGQPLQVERGLGCREYSFPVRGAPATFSSSSSSRCRAPPISLPSVIKVDRLISYVHFGILPGSRFLLNRFYIPRGLDSDAEQKHQGKRRRW
jgi:hypothetical protein